MAVEIRVLGRVDAIVDATVTTQPRSIATSKPSSSTKKSRVSAARSDLMFGTVLSIVTLRVLSEAH